MKREPPVLVRFKATVDTFLYVAYKNNGEIRGRIRVTKGMIPKGTIVLVEICSETEYFLGDTKDLVRVVVVRYPNDETRRLVIKKNLSRIPHLRLVKG